MTLSVLESAVSDRRAALWREVRASLRENGLLVALVLIYGLVPFIAAPAFGLTARPYPAIGLGYLGFVATGLLGAFAAFAFWYLYHTRVLKVPGFPRIAAQRIRTDFLRRDRLMLALPVLLLWPIMAMAFSYLKAAIPSIQPFHLDPMLHDWDRLIHFGIDPWRLLQPLLGHTWITYAVNLGYALWFFVLQAVLVLQAAATGDRRRRMQFLLSMALTWVLVGTLAATLMSSAGPCYYGLVTGGADPYAPLMEYLRGVRDDLSIGLFGTEIRIPFMTLVLQDLLWQANIDGDFSFARGISAAPSMHIASSWIIMRLAWTMGRGARIFGSLFLAMIFIGSIHLGWHYAIDGYLAIAGAWAIWRVVGWVLDRRATRALLWPQPAGANG